MANTLDTPVCEVRVTVSIIGGKWKAVILSHLLKNKVMRFGELHRTVAGITQRMLTLQLRELESDGVVTRKVYQEVPPRVEYSLTPLGQSLRPVISSMRSWGKKYQANVGSSAGEATRDA